MAIHDWTRVQAGIFHAFHHDWITYLARSLNRNSLPPNHYALPEQLAFGLGPDVLTLRESNPSPPTTAATLIGEPGGTALLAPPKLIPTAETDLAFYRRKQKSVTVRHVSGDAIVAVIEIVSPGNKSSKSSLRSFVTKAVELLEHEIHILVVDLVPHGPRDPHGIHAEIWNEVAGDAVNVSDKPLSLVAYEAGPTIKAYHVGVAVGDPLCEMPLFLEPGMAISVALEQSYSEAFESLPERWQRVLAD